MNRFAQAEVSHNAWGRIVELSFPPPHCGGRCASGGKLRIDMPSLSTVYLSRENVFYYKSDMICKSGHNPHSLMDRYYGGTVMLLYMLLFV